MLRGDDVEDEEGYRAIFAEQNASASQMAAAKFLDTVSKLLSVAGESCDAVSAYSQVKMTEAPRSLRVTKKKRKLDQDSSTTKDQKDGILLVILCYWLNGF